MCNHKERAYHTWDSVNTCFQIWPEGCTIVWHSHIVRLLGFVGFFHFDEMAKICESDIIMQLTTYTNNMTPHATCKQGPQTQCIHARTETMREYFPSNSLHSNDRKCIFHLIPLHAWYAMQPPNSTFSIKCNWVSGNRDAKKVLMVHCWSQTEILWHQQTVF